MLSYNNEQISNVKIVMLRLTNWNFPRKFGKFENKIIKWAVSFSIAIKPPEHSIILDGGSELIRKYIHQKNRFSLKTKLGIQNASKKKSVYIFGKS